MLITTGHPRASCGASASVLLMVSFVPSQSAAPRHFFHEQIQCTFKNNVAVNYSG